MQVTVIGAGVAGLTCATELLGRGVAVNVLERGGHIGESACSWWAGGMLAPWCERESAEESVARYGAQAANWWARHAGGITRGGTLVLALGRDAGDLRRFARRTSEFVEVNETQIAELEPHLASRFKRGLYFGSEAHLDPRAALRALASSLCERGANVQFGVDGLCAASGDAILDCRGLAAREALPDLRGVKGEMLILRTHEITLNRTVRLLHPRHPIYIVPREDGCFMLGATSIESSERTRVTARSLLELLGAAYALHPAFGEAEVIEIGVDARPAFDDNLPHLRRQGPRIHVNGLYRHGFLLSPALAGMAADAVLDPKHVPEWMDEHHC